MLAVSSVQILHPELMYTTALATSHIYKSDNNAIGGSIFPGGLTASTNMYTSLPTDATGVYTFNYN